MSQYTYRCYLNASVVTVIASFCSRSAAFEVKLFGDNLCEAPSRASKLLASVGEVLDSIESWGLPVAGKLENALYDDLLDWEFGDGDIRFFERKHEDFGFLMNEKVSTKHTNRSGFRRLKRAVFS